MSRCRTALGRMDMTFNEWGLIWANDVYLQSYVDSDVSVIISNIMLKSYYK
jgi:hypothetical protein